jgi:HNH endonuclease
VSTIKTWFHHSDGGNQGTRNSAEATAKTSTPTNTKGGGQLGEPDGPKRGSKEGKGSGKRATPKQREAAMKENDGKCVFCGKDAEHVDHAIPKSQGGDTTPENLQPACASCNLSKGAQTSEEFLHGDASAKVPPH